jgi:uncharacterized protein (TIGR00255 family)
MISSMTAFARKEDQDETGELICELRSVNHRYLEISLRLPEELRPIEPLVREQIGKRLSRGKVDCAIRFTPSGKAAGEMVVNERLARQIIDAAGHVGDLLHEYVPPRAMDILHWPGVLEAVKLDMAPLHQRAVDLLESATDGLVEARRREGEQLAELIRQRVDAMRIEVVKVRELMPMVLEGIRERLRTRLAEVTSELDEGRLEQEMALLAQRLDVDEEMDRLQTHLEEVDAVLQRDEPVGRRLDFLMQELNRETNTLASKSSHVDTTRVAVELKVLIEQMREQVQNIE